jgi:hypothetical protein
MDRMTEAQFDQLLSRLERIAAALERLAPAAASSAPAPEPAPAASGSGPEPAVEASEPVTLVPEALNTFLASRGIRIRRVPPPGPADSVLDRLALFLGSRYEALKDVLGWLKRTMQTGGRWHLRLAGRPQEEIGACCQFCHQLYQLAFLTEYRYHRAPHCLIEARTSTAPEAQNFLSGQWLERFVRQQVTAAAAAASCPELSLLANAQVVLPNNDDFELDLLAAAGGRVFWIESKTGAYQQYIRKYSQMARIFGIGSSSSFLVLADAPAAVCEDLSRMTGMTVCRPEDFHAAFQQAIASEQTIQRAAR